MAKIETGFRMYVARLDELEKQANAETSILQLCSYGVEEEKIRAIFTVFKPGEREKERSYQNIDS